MMRLLCDVISEPVYSDSICTFKVNVNDRTFTVVSQNRQAIKDNIFVTSRQKIEIEGKIIDDKIYTRYSRIKLK